MACLLNWQEPRPVEEKGQDAAGPQFPFAGGRRLLGLRCRQRRLRASISAGSAVVIAFTRSNSPALMASINAAASAMARFCLAAACALVTEASVSGQSNTIPEQPLLGSRSHRRHAAPTAGVWQSVRRL